MRTKDSGVIIIIALLALVILLLLGTYFLSFTVIESRISRSQEAGTKAYYLAEAGIYKAIWKLKNDDEWSSCFISSEGACPDCSVWSAEVEIDSDILVPNSKINISIQNTSCARGEIVAVSTIELPGGKTARRMIKTTVFKALAEPTEDSAIFTGGPAEKVDIRDSKINVYGNIFSNHQFNVGGASEIQVFPHETAKGKILVVHDYSISAGSSLASTAVCARNICDTQEACECEIHQENFQECQVNRCRPNPISVPVVDFDSDSEYSFKSRALAMEAAGQCSNTCNGTPCLNHSDKCVFTMKEFNDILWEVGEGGTLTLGNEFVPVIVYVESHIDLRGGRHLEVNGTLLAGINISIGQSNNWGGDKGSSQITVNRPVPTFPSGLLAKGKIDFGSYSAFDTIDITGVVYCTNELNLTSIPRTMNITGGMITRKLDIRSLWQGLNITLDNDIIRYGLGYAINGELIEPEYSPIVTVEHWEEAY